MLAVWQRALSLVSYTSSCTVMLCTVTLCTVMLCTVTLCTVMLYTVMLCTVMLYTVMLYTVTSLPSRCFVADFASCLIGAHDLCAMHKTDKDQFLVQRTYGMGFPPLEEEQRRGAVLFFMPIAPGKHAAPLNDDDIERRIRHGVLSNRLAGF
jgi:hypothetical protein